MYVRKKKNSTGTISVQVIDKSTGTYKVLKTIGSSNDPILVNDLVKQAKNYISKIQGQQEFDFFLGDDDYFLRTVLTSIDQVQLLGPELLLGKLFDEIGFRSIVDDIFRHLVITRLVYPVSKLKTTDYLFRYQGISYEVIEIYRYLDKLHKKQRQLIQQISYRHTLKIFNNELSIVFYDVTTLYFEAETEDDLRKAGFSKDGKHQNPQILLGLLVSINGYPLAYEIFEGNKFEGHTILPVVETFKKQYNLSRLVVIADAGLLSNENISQLQKKGYEFILGGRIKNEPEAIKNKILALSLTDGQSAEIKKGPEIKLLISYSQKRAQKDAFNRKRGLEKLEKALAKGKLNKQHINKRGYNKYLTLEGEISISIDYQKFDQDKCWDGLKGYTTNTNMTKEEVMANYNQLWQIEKAFRISKTDLRIRPVYHRLKRRIESHICIAFCAYKIYKELQRQLNEKKIGLSPEKAIDILKTIYGIYLILPQSKKKKLLLLVKQEEQVALLKAFNIDFGCPGV